MRLVEAVTTELFHQIENSLGLLLRNLVVRAAGHELGALRGHLFLFLLAHDPAQNIRFAQRKARQPVGNLHYLFLDEIVDHPALDRPRAVQRVQRR